MVCLLAAAAVSIGFSATAQSADAQRASYAQITYKIQVEYWFFDTESYHWSTVYETTDRDDALFVYNLLLLAKANGQLNQVAPNSYWRYIAVDVRMIPSFRYPTYVQPTTSYRATIQSTGLTIAK
jgi:hypothetical protein